MFESSPYFTNPDDRAALRLAWAAHVRETARTILVREGVLLGVGLLVAIVVDVWSLRGTPALDYILRGVPLQVAICFAGSAMLEWVPWIRNRPHAFALVGYVGLALLAGYVLGALGGMDGPFFYLSYVLPCIVIGLPASLRMRIVFTVVILATFLASFGAMRAENLRHEFAHIAWVYLAVITTAFVYFGDALHRTARERFFLEALARHQAGLLLASNRALMGEVDEKSRDVIAAVDRAASVRWEERTHLARALHDDLGQLLILARGHLRELERALGTVADDPGLTRLRDVLDGIAASSRDIVRGYRKSDVPFEVAVDDLVESFRALERVDIELELRCQEWEPESGVREACLRTVQEGLTNVFKHAEATRARVSIVRDGNSVRVHVDDDGLGVDLDRTVSGGLGLRAMRERAAELGGHFVLEALEPRGTRVEVSLPVIPARPGPQGSPA